MTKHKVFGTYHRIPRWEDDALSTLEDLDEFLGRERLGHDDLVDKLLEPGVGHDEPALLAGVRAPRVLDLVSDGLAVLIKMYSSDHLETDIIISYGREASRWLGRYTMA
jgi:hypothetical protein